MHSQPSPFGMSVALSGCWDPGVCPKSLISTEKRKVAFNVDLLGPQMCVEGGTWLRVPGFRPPDDSEITLVTDVLLV